MNVAPLFIIISLTVFLSVCKKNDNTGGQEANWPPDSVRVVSSGLNHVWEITWGPDDNLWITERNGKISRINPQSGNRNFSFNIPDVVANGEGGLLGLALHPSFNSNGLLYVVYNYQSGSGYREKLVRYRFTGTTLADPLILKENIPASGIHNGSRVRLQDDGNGLKIWFTTGDAAFSSSSQDLSSPSGKLLRLNLDGSIPSDNPIPNNPLWTYGHRNAQGLVYAKNRWYSSEHGPHIEDEVNIIEKGRNYGWPQVNGPCDGAEISFCQANNVKEPVWSSGNGTLAFCGLEYYNHDRIPAWKNSLLLVTLKDESLRQLKLSDDGNTVVSSTIYFRNKYGRLRDLCVSPAGNVYIATSDGGNSDRIIEISKP